MNDKIKKYSLSVYLRDFFSSKYCIKIPAYAMLVYLIFIIFINYVFTKYGFNKGGDSKDYIESAILFSQTFDISDIYCSKRGTANFSYCLVIGIFIALFGVDNVFALYWFNVLIAFATLVMLMKIVKIAVGRHFIIFLAGLLFSLSHLIAFWSHYVFLTDTFFMMVLVGYVLTLYRAHQSPRLIRLSYVTLSFTLLFFTKTVAIGFLPLHIGLMTYFSYCYLHQDESNSVSKIIIAVFIPIVLIIGIKGSLKNPTNVEASQYKEIVSSYYKGYIFYEQLKHKNDPFFKDLFVNLDLYEEVVEVAEKKSLLRFVTGYPGKTLELWITRLYFFWKPFMNGFKKDINQWNFATVFIPQIFAVLGLILLVYSRKFELKYWIPFLIMASNCSVYAATWLAYERRFLMPLLPFVYFYASIAVWQINEVILKVQTSKAFG